MKRILAVLLSVSLLMALLPVAVSAEEAEVTKQDISGAKVTISDQEFSGWYPDATITVRLNGKKLVEDVDYSVIFENSINIGTATVRIVGMGNYYGFVDKEFEITYGDTTVTMPGNYIGVAGGELSEDFYYAEVYLSPGSFRGYTDTSTLHNVAYQLYRVEGETPVLILEEIKGEGIHNDTMFTYDFSDVYNRTSEDWGEYYMLVYSWLDRYNRVYAGVLMMFVPSKVTDGTSLTMVQFEDGDFRADYLAAYSEDGNVENISWTSSDPGTADVEKGVVTWKKPGTVTVTARFGDLTTTQELTRTALDLTQGSITGFSAQNGTADVIYDGRLMVCDQDYTLTASSKENITEVVATGCGLFTGQLVRQYDATGEAIGHTHSFTDSCDTTCATCSFTRTDTHQLKDKWSKDQTHHWHACTACGEKLQYEEHTFSPDDPNTCTVCGSMYAVGDIDCDGEITDWDGVLLARHLAGWTVEILDLRVLDIDGDGEITDWDGVLLDRYLAGWPVTIG